MIWLLACTSTSEPPQETGGDSALDTQTEDSGDSGSATGRDILLVTEFSGAMAEDHQALKGQAAEVLAALGPDDRLGVVTDGADGCAQNGILTSDLDPSWFSSAFNVQVGPLSSDLLEATVRAYNQAETGCNVGLARPDSRHVVIILSDGPGNPKDLNELATWSPVIHQLGKGDCQGPYAEAASATGGTVTCPWQPDGLLNLLR